MTTIIETRTRTAHLKSRGTWRDYVLERCEDPGCAVEESGTADCGRLACPRCGTSGATLSHHHPTLEPGTLVACVCGNTWIHEG